MRIEKVGDESHRSRLDVFVCNMYPEVSRAHLQRLINDGRITVNGEAQKPGYRLQKSEAVKADFDPAELDVIEDIDLPVIYEDENVLVVNKPEGVISHSRGKYWNEPSVASFVRQKTKQEGERAGIVHRLDRATSGVMICAKNSDTLKHLQRQFSDRSVKKTYSAVVKGRLKEAEAIIDIPIERNPKKPQTFRAGIQGKSAKTRYKGLKANDTYSLVELLPETGRTHQLRVHLAHLGFPIVGDELYGGEDADRLLLHAHTLEITIPNGQRKVFTAKIPPIFEEILR